MKLNRLFLLALAVLAMATLVIADEPKMPEGQTMPEMGPPKEMKELAFLEGTWDVAAKMNMSMDPKAEQWTDSKGTATYAYTAGGAAMRCEYNTAPMMPGMPPFTGVMLQSFDRENKQWQAAWIDNMGARISIYTGPYDKTTMVMTGEDKMMGMTYLSRITISDQTPTKFNFKMEYSMDGGKTWIVSGTSVYTKKS